MPYASSAVTVVEKALPAVALAGAVSESVAVAAGSIVRLVLPVIVPVTVSVAVMVRLPACLSVTPLLKVWLPLSAPVKV